MGGGEALDTNSLAKAVLRVAVSHPDQAAEMMAVVELCVAKKCERVVMPTQSAMNVVL